MVTMRWRRTEATAPDPRVAVVLAAAAAPTEPGPQPGEAAALAAFRTAAPTPNRRTRMFPSLKAAAVAATATGALLTGGVAVAATGALPGAAQDTARTMLGTVGVTVPGPADAAGTHPATRGKSAATATETRRPGRRPRDDGRHQGPGGLRARHHHRRPPAGTRAPPSRPLPPRAAARPVCRTRRPPRRPPPRPPRAPTRRAPAAAPRPRPAPATAARAPRIAADPDPTRPPRTLHVGASSYRGKCDRLRW